MTFGREPSRSHPNEQGRGAAAQAETLQPAAVLKAERLLVAHETPLGTFADLYAPEAIARDEAYVHSRETSFEKLRSTLSEKEQRADKAVKEAATVFEAMAFAGIEAYGWLGPDATPFKTTKFDDYKNGVDMLVEVQKGDNPAQHLALAVDVTFGTRAQEKKFAHIREEILRDRLGVLKYFRSERSGFRGELSNIPRVVIGIEPQNVVRMSRLWLADDSQLKVLPAQIAMLEEIHAELDSFMAFARKNNKMAAISAYRRAKTVLGEIVEKKRSAASYKTLDNDRVYDAILVNAQAFKD